MSTQSPRSPRARSSNRPAAQNAPAAKPAGQGSWQRGRWTLLLLALICAAPIVVSYLTYYVIKPAGGKTNYGTLVEPQRPIPDSLIVTDENGKPIKFDSLRGRWLMISVDGSACDKGCATKLYFMRQVRATQGAERERVVTVWLRTDSGAVPDVIAHAYPDTKMLAADPAAVAAWLPAETGTQDTDHIYLVDPNGNLMMRFPKNPDPSKIKGDLTKLLKWSSIG
ncbi:cytochrome C oxidase subunit I [Trinickia violacea]|uniref:Cytochrome C oxidase subunit I n=1 Tax=Trinickia violacea TaxID=2571746 RepID=A0A4V1EGV7_9BURK|nr:cytochrome C oxidase subunit I [Trinickia violacea]QCP48110.1 cytochrome C oxidase subunit I [Trinickia violacea]